MGRRKKAAPDKRARWRTSHPWARFVEWARRRCNDTSSERWKVYRENGITCDLTAKQLKAVWIRDNAHLLKRASLDRHPDPKGNYTLDNVRFIEFNLNSRLAWDKELQAAHGRELAPDTFEQDCYTDNAI